MENIRYNISPCIKQEVSDFIDRIDKAVYIPNGEVRATERSHYDRYSFLREDSRVAVVYDTTASILSITGRMDHSKTLLELFDVSGKTVKMSTVPAQGTPPIRREEPVTTIESSGHRAKLFVSPERIRRQADVVSTGTGFASSRGVMLFTDEIYPPQTVKRRTPPETPPVPEFRGRQDADGIRQRSFEQAPRADMSAPAEAPQAGISISLNRKQSAPLLRRATISFGSDDDEQTSPPSAEFPEKRKRGRPPKILTQIPDVSVEQTQKRRGRPPKTAAVQTSQTAALKKRIPTAFGYLSEQSRMDFSYCINDFERKELKLSDYSVLLVPAFRGLERFVFDLQSAENIKVKMIGQAFDKDENGNYVLKSGYRQRINSVVYSEVVVALYTEYFSQRNFYAHSDNTDANVSRSLSDKSSAKRIFDRILDALEYNSKKLREIGFVLSTTADK